MWKELVTTLQFCSNTYLIQLSSMLVTPDWAFQPKSSKHQTCAVLLWQWGRAQPNKFSSSECSICISHTLGFSMPGDINRWLEKGHLIIYWLPLLCRNPWCKGSNSSNFAQLSQLMLPAGAALGYLHLSTNVLGLHCWKGSWSKMTTQHACPTLHAATFISADICSPTVKSPLPTQGV